MTPDVEYKHVEHPCTGCGDCCETALCHLGYALARAGDLLPPRDPVTGKRSCPYVVWALDKSRCWCGLVLDMHLRDPAKAAQMSRELAHGLGCPRGELLQIKTSFERTSSS